MRKLAFFRFQSSRPLRGATCHHGTVHRRAAPFQSSRPLRGATHLDSGHNAIGIISILAPLAGRDVYGVDDYMAAKISILAPLAGRDFPIASATPPPRYFNPRAPCGARPLAVLPRLLLDIFQSSRPLRGATKLRRFVRRSIRHFNPRAPCGARLYGPWV